MYISTFTIDIDKLLGEPIHREIEMHTGIEVSFETVNEICAGNIISLT